MWEPLDYTAIDRHRRARRAGREARHRGVDLGQILA